MNFFRKHRALLIGTGLIVITNAVALSGVAYNRSGAPESSLVLGERELSYNTYEQDDNSGISIGLLWKVLPENFSDRPSRKLTYYGFSYSREPYWLTEAKLKELGFNTAKPLTLASQPNRSNRMKNREVFLVLELNGPSYKRYVEYAKASISIKESKEEAARIIKEAEQESSRLFVIDAGLNAEALRKQYPDRKMYSITKGIVGANWQSIDGDTPILNAYINELNVDRLHVAKPYDSVFTGITMIDGKPSRKFEASLVYGKRHEPWITSAKKIDN